MGPLEWQYAALLNVAVLFGAVLLDVILPEPPGAVHPVVWMGRAISFLERQVPNDGRVLPLLAGAGITTTVVGAFGVATWFGVKGLAALGPAAYVVGGAVILKTTFAGTGLWSAAARTRAALAAGHIEEARGTLRSLVSRETGSLSPPLVTAAAIESVAENTTDSYVAPWLAFALLGVPGAVAYRAVNTLDSMLGYRGRYEYLGKAAARMDDLVNLIPARLSALLILAAGALQGFSAARGWRRLRRDRGLTASPNAGWTMAAMAGLLGVQLEKVGHYRLGEGFPEPAVDDITRAIRIARVVALLGVVVATAVLVLRHAATG